LPSMIRGLDLQGHVIFPGSHFSSISSGDKGTKGIQRELLFSRYRASDVYVSLPAGEGFGYGFAEAMMHGLPVIYTEYGGHVAYCHGHGIAVSPKGYFRGMNSDIEWAIADYSAAAQAMVKLATNRSLRKTLGERAEKAAGELFDWEVTFPEFERRVLEAYEKASAHSLYTIMQRRIL
jgi:glycosyltransferase involved in cell wall biosynthesis